MTLLQRWLDEPDLAIARLAKGFYLATFVFMAAFAVQLVFLALRGGSLLHASDVVGPLVNLFLCGSMYALALDGRRSYKALRAQGLVGPDVIHATR